MPHTADAFVLCGDGRVMLFLPVNLRGKEVVLCFEFAALCHAAYGEVQSRVGGHADEHCGNHISGARERHLGQAYPKPSEQKHILAERKE